MSKSSITTREEGSSTWVDGPMTIGKLWLNSEDKSRNALTYVGKVGSEVDVW